MNIIILKLFSFGEKPNIGIINSIFNKVLVNSGVDAHKCTVLNVFDDINIKAVVGKDNTYKLIDPPKVLTTKIKEKLISIKTHIEELKPDLLILMGDQLVKAYFDNASYKVTSLRGLLLDYPEVEPKYKVGVTFCVTNALTESANYKYVNLITKDLQYLLKKKDGKIRKVERDYRIINDFELVKKELQDKKELSFDIETTGLDYLTNRIISIAFSWDSGKAIVFPVDISFDLKKLNEIFTDRSKNFIAHNGSFDRVFLKYNGVIVSNFVFDTMLAYNLLNENEVKFLNLKILARYYTDLDDYAKDIDRENMHLNMFSEEERNKIYLYNCADADATFRLYKIFKKGLENEKLEKLYNNIVLPLQEVLIDMKLRGVCVDEEYLNQLEKKYNDQLKQLYNEMSKLIGKEINLNSVKDLRQVLFEELHLYSNEKTLKGNLSTSSDVLEQLAKQHEFPKKLIEYRDLKKKLSTYVSGIKDFIKGGMIHADFYQTVTVTGRLSCANPNLQNIYGDPEIQNIYIARPGHVLIMADLAQAEFRTWAQLSGDEKMISEIREGIDIHRTTASKVFKVSLEEVTTEQRKKAKQATFGLLYGMGIKSLSKAYELLESEAQDILKTFFSRYPIAASWLSNIVLECRKNGFVSNFFGRKRRLPGIHSPFGDQISESQRQARNSPIQSTVADYIGLSMIRLHKLLKQYNSYIIVQIHDALVIEAPESECQKVIDLVKNNMVLNISNFKVPMEVEIKVGKRLGELKNV